MEFAITAKPLSSVTTSTSSQQLSTLAAKDLSNTTPWFTVYPNPVRDNFLLDINNSYTGVMNVQVVDQSGKTKSTWVLNKPLQNTQVSLSASDLSKGIYFIRVQIGAWSETRKMLKL